MNNSYDNKDDKEEVTDAEVEEMLKLGKENPMSDGEARKLLKKIILHMRESAEERGDQTVIDNLKGDVDEMVEEMIQKRNNSR